MTKRWYSAKDYCADPSGYEAHRRARLSEAHAKELADLRRQLTGLAAALASMFKWADSMALTNGITGELLTATETGRDALNRYISSGTALANNGDEEEEHG